ncbi:MAG: hypothetical protein EPN99_07045 [Frankiales bacterium]|nr:MAG: hypothetical protein EPN99_07045 [Frankiales bacterium]
MTSAALAALTAGHPDAARRLIADALPRANGPVERAELIRLRARLTTWSGPIDVAAWAELLKVADEVADAAPDLAAAMICDAAVLAAYTRQLPQCEALALRALELTGGEGTLGALAATGLGIAYALTGRTDQAQPLLDRSADLLDADGGIVDAAELLLPAVLALVVQERYDEAVDTAARFLTAARSLGAIGLLPLPLCLLAHAGWKAGRWDEARLAAAEALSLAAGSGEVALELYAEAMLALVAGGQGRDEACRDRAARTLALSDSTGIGMFRVTANMALVHLALSRGRPQDALAPLAEVDRLMDGQRRSGMLNWHADHIAVLVQLGLHERAAEVCRLLEQEAPGNRWESAALLRCRSFFEADDSRAVESLTASVAAFSWQPYEQARSRLRLAERLAPASPDRAREQASEAHRVFTRLRARGWAAQAEVLLGSDALGGRKGELAVVPCGLEVRLLGGFAVLRDGVPVPVAAGTGAQAVKYVALQGGRVSADRLVEALWPRAEPGRGKVRLRNVLARLRQSGELLERDGDEIALVEGCAVDAVTFMEESAAALAGTEEQLRRAVARYAGELLPGDRYQDWTSGPRERLRNRYLGLLDRLAALCAGRGAVDEALQWWEQALDVEPYDEDRYIAMAALLVSAGRTGPANRVVRRAQAMLDRLSVPASPALESLATQVGA